jgi:large subunit ribosomal protein L22
MAEVFEIRASARHLPISPQKIRLVVDVVRGMEAEEALETLRYMPQKGARFVFKVIESAVANAEQNYGLEIDDLLIHRIFADDGPRRRLAPYGGRFGGRGRFKPIIKRTSHVTVVLAEKEVVEY